ncbi:alkylhydroperoxidase domain protein [Rothia halotolerans]|uniref:alkylhydroperoxidase domain protein n=1 Tax=Rothia halotolerans TaxID=405770 RepID=UPI00101C7916|nr:alkylhydroperoxidase domain protein [Rothia halotolerans]
MTAQDRTVPTADIVNLLAGIAPGDPLDRLRDLRPQAKENAQRSFAALLEPEEPGAFTIPQRYAVATFVAEVTGSDAARHFYGDVLEDEAPQDVVAAVDAAGAAAIESGPGIGVGGPTARDRVVGPYGDYPVPELAAENVPGPVFLLPAASRRVLGEELASALEYAHLLVLHPRDSAPRHLSALLEAGWDEDGVVSLAQLVSFLSFQIRAAEGLAALGADAGRGKSDGRSGGASEAGDGASEAAGSQPGDESSEGGPSDDAAAHGAAGPDARGGDVTAASPETDESSSNAEDGLHERVTDYPALKRPERFRRGGLGWLPWISPVPEAALTDRQREALVEESRTKSPYFRLLVRDPDALEARTLTDFDIFYNTEGGLSRAEREVAATVASRLNGCLFCASIHSHRAVQEDEGYLDAVQRLLDAGVEVELRRGPDEAGLPTPEADARWAAITAASAALTRTPQEFSAREVDALHRAGLEDGEIIDMINGASFFNWANRLMLSLGEPERIGV